MEINIYKIMTTRENYIEFLQEKSMRRIGQVQTYNSRKLVNDQEVVAQITTDFFFKIDSEEVQIEWGNYWGAFFGDGLNRTKTVESTFGIIIIQLDDSLYVVSLGRAHSYASSLADMDFGFDIAEVIHDEDSIEVKAAKFFKQSKNKSLTQYNRNSFVTSEIGESHEFLISNITVDTKYSNFYLYKYRDKMKFGSSVKFEASGYKPADILEIVHELHFISLNEEKSGSLPRMYFIKNNEDNQPVLADLNRELLEAAKSNDSRASLAYFIEDDGDILIEPTKDDEVEIVYSKSYTLESYTLKSISNKLTEIECNDITKVSVRPKSRKNKMVSLVKVLDFSTFYRGKNYCLFKGKWAIFNKSYIEFIKREIIKVNEVAVYKEEYDLNNQVLEEGREIQDSDKDTYDQVTYAEYPYNIFLENKFNYVLLDRKKGQQYYKNVEFADLYDEKEEMLIHVKIGDTADLRYCIQQSIHSAEIFNTQSDALEVHGIDKVRKISMLFILSSPNVICEDGSIDFLNNKSIYFQIEIIEWLIKVRTLGYTAQIIIAKDLRTN